MVASVGRLVCLAVLPLAAAAILARGGARPEPETHVGAADPAVQARLAHLPVAFVPNLGQWDHRARFVARFGAVTAFLEDRRWTLVQPGEERGAAVRLEFVGARRDAQLIAEEKLPGVHHYFLGNDRARWRSDVPLYAAVLHRALYAGIDVRVREAGGHLEYDLLVAPEADLAQVEVAALGAERLRLDADGALVFETTLGEIRQPVPMTWEVGDDGATRTLRCRYRVCGDRFGFDVEGRNQRAALVVDPGLLWSTYLGGSVQESALDVAIAPGGAAIVVGFTNSPDFPTTVGAFDTSYGGGSFFGDAFVAQISPDGSSLVYATFLGGMSDDVATAVAVDASGAATIAGHTFSPDFPTTAGVFDPSHHGVGSDVFLTRLSASGESLVYSTYLGGTENDFAQTLELDAIGSASVAGTTASSDFPATAGAFDTSFNGPPLDGFVARLSPSATSLEYATYLGGSTTDWIQGLALDRDGAAIATGWTDSTDFPTTPGAFDTSYNGGTEDVFVARLSVSGSSLVYSTFLGGDGSDQAYDIALGVDGCAVITGDTLSTVFPTTPEALNSIRNGTSDGFVTCVSPAGTSLRYSTLLGGQRSDLVNCLRLDPSGAATIAGITDSPDFPTTPGAFERSGPGTSGAGFVARLSAAGTSVLYSTFLKGALSHALALGPSGDATVVGITSSNRLPTTPGAFAPKLNGPSDAFVTRLDLLPTGVTAYGDSTPGCGGPLAIGVRSWPQIANPSFALTCHSAPPSAAGVVLLGSAAIATPLPILGARLWVDPAGAVFVATSVASDPRGNGALPLPLPEDQGLVGARLFAQFLWAGPTSPPPCPSLGLSASNALDITLQPMPER